MSLTIVATESFQVGQPRVVDADSPPGRYAVVFEDDGETGYLYAVDTDVEDGSPVRDALLVYVAADVTDAQLASTLEVGWSDDGLKALLLINVAAFCLDFFIGNWFQGLLALWPLGAGFLPWQLLTYAFLHGSFTHLFFNMLGLWMFGVELEHLWGAKRFLQFLLAATLAAAATPFLVSFLKEKLG